jgi:hypothetical protein
MTFPFARQGSERDFRTPGEVSIKKVNWRSGRFELALPSNRSCARCRKKSTEYHLECSRPCQRTPRILAAFGHWNQTFALCLFPGGLSRPPDGFGFLAILALGRLFVSFAPLHLAEYAFALHFLFENLESLIDIVVANENLQMFSNRVVVAVAKQPACRCSSELNLGARTIGPGR